MPIHDSMRVGKRHVLAYDLFHLSHFPDWVAGLKEGYRAKFGREPKVAVTFLAPLEEVRASLSSLILLPILEKWAEIRGLKEKIIEVAEAVEGSLEKMGIELKGHPHGTLFLYFNFDYDGYSPVPLSFLKGEALVKWAGLPVGPLTEEKMKEIRGLFVGVTALHSKLLSLIKFILPQWEERWGREARAFFNTFKGEGKLSPLWKGAEGAFLRSLTAFISAYRESVPVLITELDEMAVTATAELLSGRKAEELFARAEEAEVERAHRALRESDVVVVPPYAMPLLKERIRISN